MRDLRNKRAVSPVIATVILVAVAITIAVAVAYWIGGISGQYTRFEKIEVSSVYCDYKTDVGGTWWGVANAKYWQISLDLRNTGTTQASIINAFVNSKAIADFGNFTITPPIYHNLQCYNPTIITANEKYFPSGAKITVDPGSSTKIYILIKETGAGHTYSSGTTIEVSIGSGAGNSYMKMVTLT